MKNYVERRQSICTLTFWVICAVLCPAFAWAEARTTPVQVTNLLGIDPNNNTVKAQQLGTWQVNIGTPKVYATQDGIWNVQVSGNVGIAGTPNVSVANTPTVNISSTNNTVATPTLSNKVRLWTTNQILPNGSVLYASVSTRGYKEMRVSIGTNPAISNPENLAVVVYAESAVTGGFAPLLNGNFAPPTVPISQNANFRQIDHRCIFTIPVMSDNMEVQITNGTGSTVTIQSWSWAYLVN